MNQKAKEFPSRGAAKTTSQQRARSSRKKQTSLELPAGEPNLEALRSVTREWLVPLLVEKFLFEQGMQLRASRTPVQFQQSREFTKETSTAFINKGAAE
jgi:hypothetical protein